MVATRFVLVIVKTVVFLALTDAKETAVSLERDVVLIVSVSSRFAKTTTRRFMFYFFLFSVISGPASLFLKHFEVHYNVAVTLAAFSIASGAYFCLAAPFPISFIGAFSALCGLITFSKA